MGKCPMYILKLILALYIIINIGCSSKPQETHQLECVLKSVTALDENKTVSFTRKQALYNNYLYKFVVYNNGTMVVNGKDNYKQDEKNPLLYTLLISGNPQSKLKFEFNKEYDDVVFHFIPKHEEYNYDCTK